MMMMMMMKGSGFIPPVKTRHAPPSIPSANRRHLLVLFKLTPPSWMFLFCFVLFFVFFLFFSFHLVSHTEKLLRGESNACGRAVALLSVVRTHVWMGHFLWDEGTLHSSLSTYRLAWTHFANSLTLKYSDSVTLEWILFFIFLKAWTCVCMYSMCVYIHTNVFVFRYTFASILRLFKLTVRFWVRDVT